MYSSRVLIGGALLVLAQSTILRRSITNGTTSQNARTTSSSLSTSTHIAAQNQTQVKLADEGVKPATDGLKLVNEIVKPIINTRRKSKKDRSTSSSSAVRSNEGSAKSANKESLELTASSGSSSDSKGRHKQPKVSKERRGWRRWHRKCTPCPDEMKKKWRDPSISWICGGYQRARRSFKSPCMMYLRNCQDGTMFVKIHDHRCEKDDDRNDTVALRHGDHFLYDYRVVLSGDVSSYQDKTVSSSKESDEDESSDTD